MKSSEQALKEWALDQISFDVGRGQIVVLTRENIEKLQQSIVTKGNTWGAVSEALAEILNTPQVQAFNIGGVGVSREGVRTLQRAAKAGLMRLLPIDLARYGGLRSAIQAAEKKTEAKAK